MQELKQAIDEIRNRYELLQRIAESEFAIRKGLIDLELARRKMAITERTQSEILATEQITAAEIEASQKRIQAVIDENAALSRIRQQAYEALKAQLEEDLKNEAKKEEAQKKLRELEAKHAQEQVKSAKEVTEAIDKELTRQFEKRAEFLRKIQTLNDEIRNVESETAEHLRQVNQAAMDEYAKLQDNLNQAQAKLKQAADLMPKFPEQALKLAKDAQQAFASLVQNTASLRQQMSSDIALIYNALRSLQKVGMSPIEKWREDMQDVLVLLNEARRAGMAGRTKEAQELYRQAITKAEQFGTSAPEGMRIPGKVQAEGIVKQAGKELTLLNQKSIKDAENVNREAAKGIQDSGDLIKSETQRQIEAIQKNIAALDRNTETLRGKREAAAGKTEEATKTAEEAGKAKPSAGEEAPPPPEEPLSEARQRMAMETKAPAGPTPEEARKQKEAIEAAPLFGETEKDLARVEKRYQEIFPEQGAGGGIGGPVGAITGLGPIPVSGEMAGGKSLSDYIGQFFSKIDFTGVSDALSQAGSPMGGAIAATRQGIEQQVESARAQMTEAEKAPTTGKEGMEWLEKFSGPIEILRQAAEAIREASKTNSNITIHVSTTDGTTAYNSPFSGQ